MAGTTRLLATGLYARRGLKVTIRQGGPQVNQMQLMMAGRLDFNLGGGRAIEFVQQNLPFVAVAAMFQKDPSVLIAHPGQGNDNFPALEGQADPDRRRHARGLVALPRRQIRLQRFADPPLHVQPAAVPGRQDPGAAGLSGFRAVRDRTGRRFRAGGAAARRCRLRGLRQHRHDQHEAGGGEARRRAALHRCLDRGLVFLSLRRPHAGEPADQAGQPGDARRAAELRTRRDEGARHRRFGRRTEAWDRRDDRCALGGVLSLDGRCRRVSEGARCDEGVHAALRRPRVGMDLKH